MITKRNTLALLGIVASVAVMAAVYQPDPRAKAAAAAADTAERLAETTVDACRASIGFEHPRAKPGLTRTARSLPDGSFLAVVPFTVGKLERQARCIGRADGSFEFAVERTAKGLT